MKDKRWQLVEENKLFRKYKLKCTLRDLINWIQSGQIDVMYTMSYEDAIKQIWTEDNKSGIDYKEMIDDSLYEDITLYCYDSFVLPCWENMFNLHGIELKFNTFARPFEFEYEDCLYDGEDIDENKH